MIKKDKTKLLNIIFVVILIIVLYIVFSLFKQNNFNDFSKAELYAHQSVFKRDSKVKYSKNSSYKISSEDFNDAMLHKQIEVMPNTPYKVTCMVKTENVVTQQEISTSGALICIADTVEQSKSIVGTNDWQKLEFLFDSKNRNTIDIGFRLGGNEDNAKGTAWFSDFTIESGVEDTDDTWDVACFIIENIDVNIDGENIKLHISDNDINTVSQNMERFKQSCKTLSSNKLDINYEMYRVVEPLNSLSYDEENGYFVAPKNVENLIDSVVSQKEYDHIFVVVRFGNNINKSAIKVNDWIGLGGMDYYGIGFSNIRLPDNEASYLYQYNSSINTFPEEVWVHEYLHTLERNQKEYGYEVPALHNNENYGYWNQRLVGLYDWYKDYMRKNIVDKQTGERVGILEEMYTHKPIHNSNFTYSYDKTSQVFKEPSNFIEEFASIFTTIGKSFSKKN